MKRLVIILTLISLILTEASAVENDSIVSDSIQVDSTSIKRTENLNNLKKSSVEVFKSLRFVFKDVSNEVNKFIQEKL